MSNTTQLLRFITAGSVDDGKSTLIGRLLHDSKSIFEDQLSAISKTSAKRGMAAVDLSLLTDGLQAEREQGITIDVAYRYFQTSRRKFVIADTPGHVQYTRNMVTGSSTADLVVVLVDARHGVVLQSKRHTAVAALLRVPHVVLCVNKMDLVDYEASRFREIESEFQAFSSALGIPEVTCIPISALHGDNITTTTAAMPWFGGPALLEHLESVDVAAARTTQVPRLPIQFVIRPMTRQHHDYRAYAGQVAGGMFRVGDEVVVLPEGCTTSIVGIDRSGVEINEAAEMMPIAIRLGDDVDVSRGAMVCSIHQPSTVTQDVEAMICWMTDRRLRAGQTYILKHTSRTARARVDNIDYGLDVNTLERDPATMDIGANDIARVTLRTSAPLCVDAYRDNRTTGSFILIDETTFETSGAGMILGAAGDTQ